LTASGNLEGPDPGAPDIFTPPFRGIHTLRSMIKAALFANFQFLRDLWAFLMRLKGEILP
jgi:hypothetical protein